jgi:hypothetical protein
LTQNNVEADGDIHLVIKNATGQTMIAEAPNPSCVGSTSPFKAKITTVRTTFPSTLHATTSSKYVHRAVRLDGIEFLDELHDQTGVAPNGIAIP